MMISLIDFKLLLKKKDSIEKNLLSKVITYHRRHRTRQSLSKLTNEQLLDVGITREQALLEAQKPFWK